MPNVASSTGPKRGQASPAKAAFSVLNWIFHTEKPRRNVLMLNYYSTTYQSLSILKLTLITGCYIGPIEENILKETR
jgi:hypothetical protein